MAQGCSGGNRRHAWYVMGWMVQREGKGLNSQFDSLGSEELNQLFETLEEWERHLALVDSQSLRCANEHFRS